MHTPTSYYGQAFFAIVKKLQDINISEGMLFSGESSSLFKYKEFIAW